MRKNFLVLLLTVATFAATTTLAQPVIQSGSLRWGLDPITVTNSPCPLFAGPSGGSSVAFFDEHNTNIGGTALNCNSGRVQFEIPYLYLLPGAHTLTAQACTFGGIIPFPSVCTQSAPTPVTVYAAGTGIPELYSSVTVGKSYRSPIPCQGFANYFPASSVSFPPPPGVAAPQYIQITASGPCSATVGLELPFAPSNGSLWVYEATYQTGGAYRWRSVTNADPTVTFAGSFAVLDMTPQGWIAFSYGSTAAPSQPGITPKTGMWWGGQSQSGWGLQISSHASSAGDRLFAAAYIYDASGNPMWVVMPSGSWDSTHTTWSGDLYSPHGAPFSNYDATRYSPGTSLGTGQLKFSASGSAAFSYPSGADRAIQFYEFAADSTAGTYQGLWWGGPAQSGWGLSIAEQGGTLFATWYTYDASGNPAWYYMPGATRITDTHYTGALYRTTGGPWPTQVPYVGSATKVFPAGTLDLQFSNADAATMNATVDGKTVTIPISRFDF